MENKIYNNLRLDALRSKLVNYPKNIDWSLVNSLQEQDTAFLYAIPGAAVTVGGTISLLAGNYMCLEGVRDLAFQLIDAGKVAIDVGGKAFFAGLGLLTVGGVVGAARDMTVNIRRKKRMISLLEDYEDDDKKPGLVLPSLVFDKIDLNEIPENALVAIVCNLASHRYDEYNKGYKSLADLVSTICDRDLGSEEFYSSPMVQNLKEEGTVIPDKKDNLDKATAKKLRKMHLFMS